MGTRELQQLLARRLESHRRKINAQREHLFLVGSAVASARIAFCVFSSQVAAAGGDLSHRNGWIFSCDLVDASLCSTADLRDRSAARASHPAPENHESVWPPGRRGAFPRGGRVARRRYGAWRRAWGLRSAELGLHG